MHFGKKRDLFQYSHEMVHSRWTYTGRLNECIGGYISGESSFLVHCGLLLLSHRQARPCSASFPVRKISFHIIVSNSLVVRQSLWIAILRSHGSPLAILLHRKMKAIKPCRAIALREISFLELVCRYWALESNFHVSINSIKHCRAFLMPRISEETIHFCWMNSVLCTISRKTTH